MIGDMLSSPSTPDIQEYHGVTMQEQDTKSHKWQKQIGGLEQTTSTSLSASIGRGPRSKVPLVNGDMP